MIRFEHVTKSYGKTTILKDLNFTIPDGQFVILIGPSGCGKTTTMKLINRLLEPDSGIISINGKDIRLQDKVELRRHIGYVIQQIGLFPNMTVAQNISVVPKLLKYDKTRCAKIVQEMLKLVHMEDYAEKYPSELSGGQQQRIGVLRALAASPPIVLMDEPFGALDPQTREALQEEEKLCRWPLQRRCWKTPPPKESEVSWVSMLLVRSRLLRWNNSCAPMCSPSNGIAVFWNVPSGWHATAWTPCWWWTNATVMPEQFPSGISAHGVRN